MKNTILLLIVISYIIPSAFKLEAFLTNGRPVYWLVLPFLSSATIAISSLLTVKGSSIAKYITCGYLLLCGLFMIPCYFAPAIEGLPMRLFLGSYGVFWIISAIWIFRAYPGKRLRNGGVPH